MTAKTNARFLAIETLQQLNSSRKPLPVLFQELCSKNPIPPIDRPLAMNLIYGVLRQQHYLDMLIGSLCRQPLKKLHPHVKRALEVGLYQIFFLNRIPHSAAVNETVEGAKLARVPKRLHGFVNGVLRESIRQKDTLPPPGSPGPDGHAILNHPQWLTSRWQNRFGWETMQEICSYNNIQQPLVLRVNTLKTTRDALIAMLREKGIEAGGGRYAPGAVLLPSYQGQISALPGYDENLFQVQGEAAQLVSLLLGSIAAGGRYLDGCAGLGGKTSHLLQLLKPHGAVLTAVEPEPHRLEILEQSLEKESFAEPLTIYHGDLQSFAAAATQKFDGILIDAPCSGTGVISRQPDIRWRRTAADITRYAASQLVLLDHAASLLRPGAVLVYATCSLEPEENMEVIDRLLGLRPELELSEAAPWLPEEAGLLVREGCFQPRPSDGLDGFFGARLVSRKGDD